MTAINAELLAVKATRGSVFVMTTLRGKPATDALRTTSGLDSAAGVNPVNAASHQSAAPVTMIPANAFASPELWEERVSDARPDSGIIRN